MPERIHPLSPAQHDKLLGLEIIRFLSAISIVIWHYQHFSFVADKPVGFVREQQPLYALLSPIYEHGFRGVSIFWCISGFIFFWKYKHAISAKMVGPRRFFILRFSRLYPLHFATLLLVAALQTIYFSRTGYFFVYQNNDIFHFVLQLFMATNWGPDIGRSFNEPIWSISVEIVVYFVFFTLARRIGGSFLINIGVLLLCVVAKLLRIPTPIVDCLAFFYAGGLSAIAVQYFERTKYERRLNALAGSFVVVLPTVAYAANLRHYYFSDLSLMLLMPPLLFACARMTLPAVAHKTIEAAGNMTYSSYLIHIPIQLVIALCFSAVDRAIPFYSLTFFMAYLSAILVASYFTYRLFELPAQTWLRAYLK